MGFFDSSSSSSNTTENTYNTDNTNIGADQGGVALRNSTQIVIDPGAFDLAKKSLDTVGAAVTEVTGASREVERTAFDFLSSAFEKSLAFTGDIVTKQAVATASTIEKAQSNADASLKQFVALADQSNKQGVQSLTENVFKYGAWLLVGLAAAGGLYAYSARKGHA